MAASLLRWRTPYDRKATIPTSTMAKMNRPKLSLSSVPGARPQMAVAVLMKMIPDHINPTSQALRILLRACAKSWPTISLMAVLMKVWPIVLLLDIPRV